MNYRVKVRGGLSIFHDKELAEKCAKKNKTKVEEIKPVKEKKWTAPSCDCMFGCSICNPPPQHCESADPADWY